MTPLLRVYLLLIQLDFQGLHQLHLQLPLPMAHAQLRTYHKEEPLKASLQTNWAEEPMKASPPRNSTRLWQLGRLCTHMITQHVGICSRHCNTFDWIIQNCNVFDNTICIALGTFRTVMDNISQPIWLDEVRKLIWKPYPSSPMIIDLLT